MRVNFADWPGNIYAHVCMHTQQYTVSTGTCLLGAYPIVSFVHVYTHGFELSIGLLEDDRLTFLLLSTTALKPTTPFGQLPFMNIDDSEPIAQSGAMSLPNILLKPPAVQQPYKKRHFLKYRYIMPEIYLCRNTDAEGLKYIYGQRQMHAHTFHLQIQMQL